MTTRAGTFEQVSGTNTSGSPDPLPGGFANSRGKQFGRLDIKSYLAVLDSISHMAPSVRNGYDNAEAWRQGFLYALLGNSRSDKSGLWWLDGFDNGVEFMRGVEETNTRIHKERLRKKQESKS